VIIEQIRMPPTLHHYTSGSGLVGIFETSQIWASSIHSLNDSTEFSHALDIGKAAIRDALNTSGVARADDLYEPIVASLNSMSRLAMYVTCFSTVGDSLSQWRGYCPPAFGYSIGFDGEMLRNIVAPQGFQLNKCIYDRDTQQAIVGQWAQRTVARLLPGLPLSTDLDEYVRENSGDFLDDFLEFAPFLKHWAFKDEDEWRLAGLVAFNDPRMRVRAGRSMLIRYVPIDLHLNKRDQLISGVRVGPTPHPELAAEAVTHYWNKVVGMGVSSSSIPYRDW
jgi:hypothetical protein